MSFVLPRAIPANRPLFRITMFQSGEFTVTAKAAEKNEAGELTGKVIRWKMHELSSAHLKIVGLENGEFTVEYWGSPYLYNAPKNGTMACSCPRVRLKSSFKNAKDALWAAIEAKQVEDDLRYVSKTVPAPGTLPATPVRSGENDLYNARYDA